MRDIDGKPNAIQVLVGTFLAPEHINQIWAVDPRIEVLYDPALVGQPRFACDHQGPVRRTRDQEERWFDMLARCEVLFGLGSCDSDDLLAAAPCLKWIQSTSAGVGQRAHKMGLTGSGVTVTTASGVHATPLAEFALMSMLFFVKDGFYLVEEQKRKHWQRYTGGELSGRTLAVIGLGSIGQEVARLARCFGMAVIGSKRHAKGVVPETVGVDALYSASELHTMLGCADFVAITVPHTPETEGMIGRAELDAMRPGSVLINMARGATVDEAALLGALESGQLGGAALDVMVQEPLPANSPLWDRPNVLLCPHSGSNVDSEDEVLLDLFCENLRLYLAQKPLLNVLDAELLY